MAENARVTGTAELTADDCGQQTDNYDKAGIEYIPIQYKVLLLLLVLLLKNHRCSY